MHGLVILCNTYREDPQTLTFGNKPVRLTAQSPSNWGGLYTGWLPCVFFLHTAKDYKTYGHSIAEGSMGEQKDKYILKSYQKGVNDMPKSLSLKGQKVFVVFGQSDDGDVSCIDVFDNEDDANALVEEAKKENFYYDSFMEGNVYAEEKIIK